MARAEIRQGWVRGNVAMVADGNDGQTKAELSDGRPTKEGWRAGLVHKVNCVQQLWYKMRVTFKTAFRAGPATRCIRHDSIMPLDHVFAVVM